MSELTLKINADWAKLTAAADNLDNLDRFLENTPPILQKTSQDLKDSLRHGAPCYKKTALLPFFDFLAGTNRVTPTNAQLLEAVRRLSLPVYVTLIQQQLASGRLEMTEEKEGEVDVDVPDVKEILMDITRRIAADPGMARHPSVKTIQMKMSIYKKELETFKKLAVNIQPDKKEAFTANFRHKIGELTESIQKLYTGLVQEDLKENLQPTTSNPLKHFELKKLAARLETQAKAVYGIKSTVTYLVSDGYKKREILQNLFNKKILLFSLFEEEVRFFGEKDDNPVYRRYIEETIAKVNRQADRLSY